MPQSDNLAEAAPAMLAALKAMIEGELSIETINQGIEAIRLAEGEKDGE